MIVAAYRPTYRMDRDADKEHPEIIGKDECVHGDDDVKNQRRPMRPPKLCRARSAQEQGVSRYRHFLEQGDDFRG